MPRGENIAINQLFSNPPPSCNGPFNTIKQTIPDVHTLAIMIGDNLEQDEFNSVLMKANTQVGAAIDVTRL